MKGLKTFAVLLIPLFLCVACKNNLVSATTMDYNEKKNAADYEDYILPPLMVEASHGKKKCVLLSWKPVKNAVQYQIYSAETPYSTFSKVSETKEAETEIVIDEESGITKYYCVCAVNYYGTVSSKSIVAKGSTLAVPVITSIDPKEEGNSVNVNWWMDNCASDTYADLVEFNVNVYALSAPSVKAQSLTVDGNCRVLNIESLTPKTEYFFEVEVINKESLEKESSGKTTAETARKVIPAAPLGFEVSQGDFTDKIVLTWNLPEGCWYRENLGVSGFVLHPLYFIVYRKLASDVEEKYKPAAKVFVQANDQWKYRKVLVTGEGVYEITAADSDKKLADPYGTYVPDAQVYWEDTTAERGKKYSYYIQSVTDDTPEGKTITSDASKTESEQGWLISIPSFSIDYKFEKSEDNTSFTKISCDFNVCFEPYEKPYTYIIVRNEFDLDDPTVEIEAGRKKWSFTSIEDINNTVDEFTSPAQQKGYYTYSFYICPEGSTDISSASQTVAASGKYLVTDDVHAVPVIEDFKLRDGFNNHFELSWKYNSQYIYILHWQDVIGGVNGEEQTQEISADCFEGKSDGDIIIYNHAATSGDRRIYLLEASTGLSESFRPNDDTSDKIYETLGTPEPKIDSYEYDKLCVSWKSVQKASADYVVSAHYEGDDTELVIPEDQQDVTKNIEITNTGTEEEPVYTCVISKPMGYDDALMSGKNIILSVTAKSADDTILQDNQTTAEKDVCTVGPALTELSVGEQKKSDRIYIKWSPVTGADGYIIRRITYKTASANPAAVPASDIDNSNTDCYYYDGTGIFINGAEVSPARAGVELINGQYKFSDIDAVQTDNLSSYEKNQSYIKWGIPYGYVVIPVKENGQKDDFEFTGKDIKLSDTEVYTNLDSAEKFGATEGYGLAVHAEKSESSGIQKIEWNVPYGQDKTPVVYCRDSGAAENIWEKVTVKSSDLSVISGGKQTASFTPETLNGAYEYIVAYNVTSSTLAGVVPSSFIDDEAIGLSAKDSVYSYSNEVPLEKSNKGYLLAVDYSADTGSGYSEEINWDEWNYQERSLGPTGAYIRIRNYNISSEWKKVAKLGPDLHFISAEAAENTTVTGQAGAVSFIIEPTELMDGTLTKPVTKGYMQVLRDAKHYYSIEFIRGDDSYEYGIDGKVYAYRNINDYEFAKMVMAELSNAFINIDILGFETKSDGNATFTHKATIQWGYDYEFNFNGYSSAMAAPTGNYVNAITVNCKGICSRNLPGSPGYPKKFEAVTINATTTDAKMPDCYNGSITFSLSSHKSATITAGTTTINMNSDDLRRIFVPFKLHGDENIYYNDIKYGWWPE